jgi:hypothetical protein
MFKRSFDSVKFDLLNREERPEYILIGRMLSFVIAILMDWLLVGFWTDNEIREDSNSGECREFNIEKESQNETQTVH